MIHAGVAWDVVWDVFFALLIYGTRGIIIIFFAQLIYGHTALVGTRGFF